MAVSVYGIGKIVANTLGIISIASDITDWATDFFGDDVKVRCNQCGQETDLSNSDFVDLLTKEYSNYVEMNKKFKKRFIVSEDEFVLHILERFGVKLTFEQVLKIIA